MLKLDSFEWRVANPAVLNRRESIGPYTWVEAPGVEVTGASFEFGGGSLLPINVAEQLAEVEDPALPVRTHLTCGREYGLARKGRAYHPEKDAPGLFRQFAALPAEKEAINRFANEYGLLGVWHLLRCDPEDPTPLLRARLRHERNHRPDLLIGEPFSLWQQEIETLQWCVSVLDGLRKDDQPEIERLLEQRPEQHDRVPGDLQTYAVRSRGALVWQERAYRGLQEAIGTRIGRWCPLSLECEPPRETVRRSPQAGVGMEREPTGSVARIVARPRNLLALLWMQLANEIDTDARFDKCICGCEHWFPKDKRGKREFFSHACRQRVYRKQKEGAHPGE